MLKRHLLIACMFPAGLMVVGADVVFGQLSYPGKPIRMITSSAGGGTDFVARLIAQGIAGPLGQQVIVDNRPSGVIPGETAAKAAPDGYTVLAAGGILWLGPLIQKTPYDTVRDFSPISLTARSPNILVVHPSLPVKTAKELIALAKSRPGDLNYGSAGQGGSSHLAAELFKAMAGVDIVHVPYKGSGPAINAVVGGQLQVMFATVSVLPFIKSGRLHALAVTSAQPTALAPGLPTVAATGLPGYESVSIDAVFAPAKTSEEIINRLSQEIARFLRTPELKEKFLNSGLESVGSTSEQLAATIKLDIATFGKVIKDAGIRAD